MAPAPPGPYPLHEALGNPSFNTMVVWTMLQETWVVMFSPPDHMLLIAPNAQHNANLDG